MKLLLVIVLCIAGTVSADGPPEEHPEVAAPAGRIRGSVMRSRLGRKIYSFRGVRYAEPPIGQQRFQLATPAARWQGVYDATEEGPGCPRQNAEFIAEDCLRLNVYTTKLPSKRDQVKRPVMVFIHPGAFYSFSGQSYYFGPQYLLDKDLVLVTINYRLGSLGFFSTGDSLAPGNLGMKDQVVALQWVQRNIAAFGGDPNSVTISGYSIGGVSVMLHMLSPMSKNLFHRGIAMSGGLVGFEPHPTHQRHLAKKQAELLGCPTDTTGSMLICLNTKPVENFTNTMGNFFEYYGDPILVWNVVVESEAHGGPRFLPDQPVNLIRQGKFHQVPLIMGVTKDEFGVVVSLFEKEFQKGNDTLYRTLNDEWDRIAPISFMYERDTPRSKEISTELRKFFFHDKPINSENKQGIADLYADSTIVFPMYRSANLFAANSRMPVYFYDFTYQGRHSFAMWNDTTPYGISHHDDLQYLFYMKEYFPYLEKDAPELAMLERYTAMWANFVQTGEPIPKNNNLFKGVTWERYVPERNNYLEINLHPTMKTGLHAERMQFWERIFPLPPARTSRKTKN